MHFYTPDIFFLEIDKKKYSFSKSGERPDIFFFEIDKKLKKKTLKFSLFLVVFFSL